MFKGGLQRNKIKYCALKYIKILLTLFDRQPVPNQKLGPDCSCDETSD